MTEPRRGRRPGRLWLFFWGRKRRGFPGLLVAIAILVLVLGLSYGVPGGAGLGRWIGIAFLILIALVASGALLLALAAGLRRPGRR
ncbi:MAG: hypothetical protein ACREPA_07875 [Candidatus Dormibacteraceae bacterium]